MVTRLSIRRAIICAFLVLMLAPAFAQQAADPATSKRPARQSVGLLDFALKRVNPSDRDFGKCIDEGRKILLQETIENGYFWSNLISLALLGCFLLTIIHQHKVQRRRELIVAESLAQYQHALARADVHIKEATERNLKLMEALSLCIEHGAPNNPAEPQPRKSSSNAGKTSAQNVAGPGNSSPSVPVPANTPARSRPQSKPAAAIAPIAASTPSNGGANPRDPNESPAASSNVDVDLVAKINMVQQQLTGSQEREKQLRRQLNEAELRLQKEQQKNRSLKGE